MSVDHKTLYSMTVELLHNNILSDHFRFVCVCVRVCLFSLVPTSFIFG